MLKPLHSLPSTRALWLFVVLFAPVPSLAQLGPLPIDSEFPVSDQATDLQEVATVVVAADGTFVAVWESLAQDTSGDGIFLRRFDADGVPLTGDVPVNTTVFSNQTDPDIAQLADGGFVVVWDSDADQDGSERGIYGQRFDTSAAPVGDEILINEVTDGDQNDAVVAALPDGGFLVLWETQTIGSPFEDVVARRFDPSGLPLDGEVAVNSTTLDDQEDIDVGCDAQGSCVAVWESEGQDGSLDSVIARRLSADGTPLGSEIPVNTFLGGNQDDPDLVVLQDGRFFVAWEDDSQDSGVDAIYARAFAADGTPLDAPFKVDSDPGPERNPRIAADPEGRAIVIWDNLGQDGSGIGVFLGIFDASGTRLGPETAVNTSVAGDQWDPHLAIAGGRGVAVWTTPDGSLDGIAARRIDLVLFADGFESGDTTSWHRTVP